MMTLLVGLVATCSLRVCWLLATWDDEKRAN
jgi:hypothetical protein